MSIYKAERRQFLIILAELIEKMEELGAVNCPKVSHVLDLRLPDVPGHSGRTEIWEIFIRKKKAKQWWQIWK